MYAELTEEEIASIAELIKTFHTGKPVSTQIE